MIIVLVGIKSARGRAIGAAVAVGVFLVVPVVCRFITGRVFFTILGGRCPPASLAAADINIRTAMGMKPGLSRFEAASEIVRQNQTRDMVSAQEGIARGVWGDAAWDPAWGVPVRVNTCAVTN
ncbi:MAG: hypothetical protein KGL39_13030 [Patescibacteria group bacterium]|nr:hypothetical protein [Patescibacteria group bacterium]